MSKRRAKDLSRRDFLRVSAGAVVVTSIGCLGESNNGVGGTGGATGQGGDGAGGNFAGAGGGLAQGGTGASGGRAGGVVTGGTTAGGSGKAGAGKAGATGGRAGSGAGAGSTGGGSNPLVAMVRGTDWARATRDAIDMVGGLPDLTGKTVMLRPNVISSNPHPETTNPEVIRGAIQAVKAKGAARIIVAEDGFANARTGSGTLAAMTTLKITEMCQKEGAEALDLKGRPTVAQSPSGATQWSGGINFYKDVLDADYVINIPVCKTHGSANFSMAIKAWFGCVPERPHSGNLHSKLAELHLVKQENFVVLDATKAMVTGGPQNGTAADSQIVVATRDPIAADVTGLCIIKQFGPALGGRGAAYNLKVWEQPQIIRAMALNFDGWLSSEQKFEYAQQGVTEHADIMAWRTSST